MDLSCWSEVLNFLFQLFYHSIYSVLYITINYKFSVLLDFKLNADAEAKLS